MEQRARVFPLNAPARSETSVSAEVRYRMLVEQIPAVTYIADFTADAPFLYVSPQIEELLGLPGGALDRRTRTSGPSASIRTTESACSQPSA